MEASYQVERFVTLRLNEKEAEYLHLICNSPKESLYPVNHPEPSHHSAIRCELFRATDPRSENGMPIGCSAPNEQIIPIMPVPMAKANSRQQIEPLKRAQIQLTSDVTGL